MTTRETLVLQNPLVNILTRDGGHLTVKFSVLNTLSFFRELFASDVGARMKIENNMITMHTDRCLEDMSVIIDLAVYRSPLVLGDDVLRDPQRRRKLLLDATAYGLPMNIEQFFDELEQSPPEVKIFRPDYLFVAGEDEIRDSGPNKFVQCKRCGAIWPISDSKHMDRPSHPAFGVCSCWEGAIERLYFTDVGARRLKLEAQRCLYHCRPPFYRPDDRFVSRSPRVTIATRPFPCPCGPTCVCPSDCSCRSATGPCPLTTSASIDPQPAKQEE